MKNSPEASVPSYLPVDVLCIGQATYDLVLSISHHPAEDEKMFADALLGCGGGPAANGAVTVARLGYRAAFAGYLGNDPYGQLHADELIEAGVDIRMLARGSRATPLSVALVKPGGHRALVNYREGTFPPNRANEHEGELAPKVVLMDGHEPERSLPHVQRTAVTVLDAGSIHAGTRRLMSRVDHLVCSEKFARQWLGENAPKRALESLSKQASTVVITLGEHGLIWSRDGAKGALPAFSVDALDTTGAGDVFHGAYAAGLAAGLPWNQLLIYASAAGALCCERLGARTSIPDRAAVEAFLNSHAPREFSEFAPLL